MKNNIKNACVIISLILILTFLVVVFGACKESEKDILGNSMSDVKAASFDISVFDNGVKVYGYKKSVTLQETKAEIATEESKLNSGFVLESNTTYDSVENPDLSKLIVLDLNDELIDSKERKNDVLTLKVKKENAPKVLGIYDYGFAEDIVVRCVFNSKRLESVTSEFTADSGRTLVVTYTYSY